MSISESTALARAAAVKASFPKGKINVAQAKAMLLAMVDSQVGYASGSSSRSLYAERENWPEGSWSTNQREAQGYWCYRGISWSFAMCFGRAATIAGIGNQGHFPFPGWAATWLGMAWMKARGMGVSISNAQPGDLSFQSWGRTGNPTDHIEVVTGRWSGASLPHTGFNTSSGSGSVTTGATVARVWRPSWPIKFIGRPDWAALVATYNASVVAEEIIDWTSVHRMLLDLGYPASESGVRAFQSDKDDWGHNLTVDGVPGDQTCRALESAVSKIDEVLNILNHHVRGDLSKGEKAAIGTGQNLPLNRVVYLSAGRVNALQAEVAEVREKQNDLRSGINVVGRVAAEGRELARSVPQRVIAARVPFTKGTSLHRLFGDHFRFGALLGYAGGAMVDRDTHTEEIVDALDGDTLQSEIHENEKQAVTNDGASSAAVEEQE